MKIAILSCFHPFRGGIAQFNASVLGELGKAHTVKAFNFTLQYPALLFPGKTQYVQEGDTAVPVESEALLSTINPFTWRKTAKAIRDWGADLLIVRYWMSWFAPSLGSVARMTGSHCKVIAITDNVLPHERHFFDKPFTKWFLKAVDGCVTMSSEVAADLKALMPGARYVTLPHPLYTHFGERIPRAEAERALGLEGDAKTLLFFGLIRKYKGLDILLDAFAGLPEDYRLVIAGEAYGDFAEYARAIEANPNRERIFLHQRYIPDNEVALFFSAADAVVLPYRSATQSGVEAIATQFEVAMIVTDTGALRASVEGRGTGLVADRAEPECVREAVLRFFDTPGLRESCHEHILQEKRRLSWSEFCKGITGFYETL